MKTMGRKQDSSTPVLTRRSIIGGGLYAGAATLLSNPSVGADDHSTTPVVDTHLHCFAGADDARFPYHSKSPYQPESPATPEHLITCMDGAGVTHAVVVHPEPYQDDHRYLQHCLNVGGDRLKGTCLFFADRPSSLAAMPGFLRKHEGKIIAARIHAYAPDRLPPFGTEQLRQYWKSAADAGVAIQLHFEPRYAPGLEPFIKEFSDTTVIIDHLGRPFQGTAKEHAVVMRWAEQPNTVMKLSSIPPQNKYPHRDVAPMLRQLTDAWGAERLIYGGGFSSDATPKSYRQYRENLSGMLGHLSAGDQAKVFGENAARLFGLSGK